MLEGANICVLDIETRKSADSCRHCGELPDAHLHHPSLGAMRACRPPGTAVAYEQIGWEDHALLGISIGCYFDYVDGNLHWFDQFTLGTTMDQWRERQTLLVSFNGTVFDIPLMLAVRRQQIVGSSDAIAGVLVALCEAFETYYATHAYDLLAEIWALDPDRKFERGLNSLDTLRGANGLPRKTMTGAQAPVLLEQGRYAEVVTYNVSDVLSTKALFEMACAGMPIIRGDETSLTLPLPKVLSSHNEVIL